MKKFIVCVCLLLCVCCYQNVRAADTLGDLKSELATLKEQKRQQDAAKNKTQSEINAENNKIANAHSEVEKSEGQIAAAKVKIEESNDLIKKTKDESAQLLIFYQKMQNDESVIDYVSGASDMTDMIMRIEAVSQLINYNEGKLNKLENEIVENEKLQVDLTKYQGELEENIKTYEKSLASLKNDLSSLVEVSLDLQSQINAQQELIEYYEEVGCKDSDLISVCAAITDSARWLKPTVKGYISSGFGYRSFYLNDAPYSDYHPGNDVAGNNGGTPVYAVANGTVAAIIWRSSCGGNQVFLHVRVKGVAYTIHYAHLLNVYVGVGDHVDQSTIIGTVGGGGSTLRSNGGWDTCSTGYHLHFAVANGFYLGGGAEGYSSWSTFIAKSIQPPMLPAYGNWFYSRY